MQIVTLNVGSAAGRDYPTLAAAWAAIPANLVTADVSYRILLWKDTEFVQNSVITLSGKTTDANHTIWIGPADGQGYANVFPAVLNNALRYNPQNGVAFKGTINGGFMINNSNDYTTVEGIQVDVYGANNTLCGGLATGTATSVVKNCLLEHSGTDTRTDITINVAVAAHVGAGSYLNNLTVLKGTNSHGLRLWTTSPALVENCTFVRLPSLARSGTGIFAPYNSNYAFKTIRNCAAFNMELTQFPAAGAYDHCAGDGVFTVNGSGHLQNVSAASVFVDPTYDLRLKAGAPLIDAGANPSGSNLNTISGNRQMGTSADIGAWEYPQALAAPSSKITKITVTGNQVTVDGTYTGLIDSVRVSMVADTAVTGNNAVSQLDTLASYGNGTFSATFTGCKVGKYGVTASVSNSAYTTQATNDQGGVEIIGGRALSVVQDPISGQVYSLHGTCANATGGSLVIPPAANSPNGAVGQNLDLTINTKVTPNTWSVATDLEPGNYDAGILTFTNADGRSLPQAGTVGVTIYAISGYPQSPVTTVVNPPVATITGVAITPKTATGAQKFSAEVLGTNGPSQGINWSVTGGGSIDQQGNFTPPAATTAVQTCIVKAASLTDSSFFDTATVTIAAIVVVPDPDPEPDPVSTVTGITLASFNSILKPSTQYTLNAVVQGTNNPSQAVDWTTTLGDITDSGVLTTPAATTAIQNGSITATSQQDVTKSVTINFQVEAKVIVVDPDPDPTDPTDPVDPNLPHYTGEGTLVEFHFITPDNLPIANSRFEVQLKRADFGTQVDGVMMPRLLEGVTDAHGKRVLELVSCDTPYYAVMEDPVSEAGLVYLFYVPDVKQPTVVRLQDIVVDSISTTVPIDQAILAQILEAKAAVLAAKAAIDAKFTALAGPEGAKLVGYKTGTVFSALEAGTGTGSGGGTTTPGTGGGAVMGEVMIANTSAAQLDRIDGTLGNMFTINIDANFVLPPVKNPVPGTTYVFLFQQDAAGGHAVTLDKKYRWPNNAAYTFNTAPNLVSKIKGDYSSLGFFFTEATNGIYAVSGLARIGRIVYETVAQGYNALKDGETLYITRDGQMSEVITPMIREGTYTVAGAPELGTIPKLRMDKTVRAAWGKGLFNIEYGNVTIRDLWIDGAVNDVDETISGIRYNGGCKKLIMQRVKITACNNGQLAGAPTLDNNNPPGGFHVEHIDCEFSANGLAYIPKEQGQSHNIYLNHRIFYYGLRNKYINAVNGHDFKTRADYVVLDRCLLEGSANARELDIPNGGVTHVVNCIIRKRAGASQGNMIGIGLEGDPAQGGLLNDKREYIFRNCVLDNSQGGNFSETWIIQRYSNDVVKFVDCVFIGSSKCVMVTPFELYYTGGPIGPEGWDQNVKGIQPKWGTTDSMAGNKFYDAAQQPQPQRVDVDPTLVAFPPTGSTATPTTRNDAADKL